MKRVNLALGAAVAAVLLVGCGSGEEPTAAPERTTVAVDEPEITSEPENEADEVTTPGAEPTRERCFNAVKGKDAEQYREWIGLTVRDEPVDVQRRELEADLAEISAAPEGCTDSTEPGSPSRSRSYGTRSLHSIRSAPARRRSRGSRAR